MREEYERRRRPATPQCVSAVSDRRGSLRVAVGIGLGDAAGGRGRGRDRTCTVVQRAAEAGVVGGEERVAAGRRTDPAAPVGRDPAAALADTPGQSAARSSGLHDVVQTRRRQSKGDPSVDLVILRSFSYEVGARRAARDQARGVAARSAAGCRYSRLSSAPIRVTSRTSRSKSSRRLRWLATAT
jgi:hypothetical protein